MRVDRLGRKAARSGAVPISQDATGCGRSCGVHTGGDSLDTLLIADARERALGLPDRVLLAALDYVLRERVVDAVAQGDRVAARVLGARDEYRAEAALAPFGQARCSCSLRPPCRHSAAVVVAHLRQPERFARLPAEGSPLADALFALVAGRPEPLAALRPAPAQAAAATGAPDWAALRAGGGRSALDAVLRFLERATDQGRRPLEPDQAEQTAQTLAALVPLAAQCHPALARRLCAVQTGTADDVVARALGAFLHALEGGARTGAQVAAEHAVWGAADGAAGTDGGDAARRARRALDWLCEDGRVHGGEAEALAVARAHHGLPGAAVHEALSLWRLGRPDEAAHVAQTAYLHAEGEDSARLYGLMREMGRAGHAGAIAFLRAAWEADPDPGRLEDLLGMGDAPAQAATRAAAETVLSRRHRFDLLAALARRDGDAEAAVRWALRDGAFAAAPDDCRALADGLAAERPLLAIELLGAAYRREAQPERRRRLIARARALGRGDAELGQAWPVLRRRWFPEGSGQARPARPS